MVPTKLAILSLFIFLYCHQLSFAESDYELPELDQVVQPSGSLAKQIKLTVTGIRIKGNTLLANEQIAQLIRPFLNKKVSMSELQDLRLALTDLYHQHGYIAVNVLLPDQTVSNGEVIYVVVEGSLEQIEVVGNKRLSARQLTSQLKPLQNQPVNLSSLQEQLVLLKKNSMIARLSADLSPGAEPGSSKLVLEVEETSSIELDLALNNHRSPSIGSEQVELRLANHSLTGHNDSLSAGVNKTEGALDLSLKYSIPLTRDLRGFAYYHQGDSEVVEKPFNIIDIESEFREAALGIELKHFQQRDQSLSSQWALEQRQSKTFLDGDPFPFGEGVEADGSSRVTALRWSLDYLKRFSNRVLALSSSFSQGLDLFNPTINDKAPDGEFSTWLGQVQFAQRFNRPQHELFLRSDIKLASQSLLPMEKLALGGANTVRGYRENLLVVDQGMVASAEYRFGLINQSPTWGNLQGAAFFDLGLVFPIDKGNDEPRQISSAGLGLRWTPTPKLNLQLYAAKAFRSVPRDPYNLQDSGIHLDIRYSSNR